jgi:hypothetical protein
MPYRRQLHSKRKMGFGALCEVRGRETVTFMMLVLIALHLTLQARYLNLAPNEAAQGATLSSSKSALMPPNEHANAFWHQEIHVI